MKMMVNEEDEDGRKEEGRRMQQEKQLRNRRPQTVCVFQKRN